MADEIESILAQFETQPAPASGDDVEDILALFEAQPPVSAPAAPVSPPARRTERTVEAQPVETPPVDVGEGEVGFGRRMGRYAAEMITGKERRVPETEALPSWADMPEIDAVRSLKGVANVLTGDVTQEELIAAATTLLTNPEETSAIIQSQFPGVKVRTDEKGNIIFRSAEDKKEYAIKPGARWEDSIQVLTGILSFSPVGVVRSLLGKAAVAGATQAGIEAAQSAAGGEFDPEEIAMAGGSEVILPGLSRAVSRFRQRGVGGLTSLFSQRGPGPFYRSFDEAPRIDISEDALFQIIDEASVPGRKGKKARASLALIAQTNDEARQAAQELGISLPFDQFSESQRLRAIVRLARSQEGSPAQELWDSQYKKAINQADDLMARYGATYAGTSEDAVPSLGKLSSDIRQEFTDSLKALEETEENLWKVARPFVPKTGRLKPNALLNLFSEIVEEQGSERGALKVLGPIKDLIRESLSKGSVTYGNLDLVRRQLGQYLYSGKLAEQFEGAGIDREALGKAYFAIRNDTLDFASRNGGIEGKSAVAAAFEAGNTANTLSESFSDLYGRAREEGSIASAISSAISSATGKTRDTTKLVNIINSLPEAHRENALMTAIATASSNRNGRFSFSNFERVYQGLRETEGLYPDIAKNLSKENQEFLRSMYVLSKSVNKYSNDLITTGKSLQATLNERFAENFITKLVDKARIIPGIRSFGVVDFVSNIASRMTPKKASNVLSELFSDPRFLQDLNDISGSERMANRAAISLSRNPKMRKVAVELGFDPAPGILQKTLTGIIRSTRQGRVEETLDNVIFEGEQEEGRAEEAAP